MAKKLLAGLMVTAMVGCAFSGSVMAEEAELLPGGGSNIIYCITLPLPMFTSRPCRISRLLRARSWDMK